MNWLHLDPLGKAREQELDPLRTLDIGPHLVFRDILSHGIATAGASS